MIKKIMETYKGKRKNENEILKNNIKRLKSNNQNISNISNVNINIYK